MRQRAAQSQRTILAPRGDNKGWSMIRWPVERPLSMSISEPVAAIRKAKFAARVVRR